MTKSELEYWKKRISEIKSFITIDDDVIEISELKQFSFSYGKRDVRHIIQDTLYFYPKENCLFFSTDEDDENIYVINIADIKLIGLKNNYLISFFDSYYKMLKKDEKRGNIL